MEFLCANARNALNTGSHLRTRSLQYHLHIALLLHEHYNDTLHKKGEGVFKAHTIEKREFHGGGGGENRANKFPLFTMISALAQKLRERIFRVSLKLMAHANFYAKASISKHFV